MGVEDFSEANQGRRDFLQLAGKSILGSAMVLNLGYPNKASAFSNKTLKVGLIGCGGRGTGAAVQALKADPDVLLTAMADVFPDRMEKSYNAISTIFPDRIKVKDSRFIGFDAYKKVIESDVDVIILTTPPVFRPDHFTEAVNAGKHIFCEKPVAVDAPGINKIIAASKKAKEKKLSVVSGFCYRYDFPKRTLYERIKRGDIGEIKTISSTRNVGQLNTHPRQSGWTDFEYQMRNWQFYSWLSGDFIAEMMVHCLNLMSWALNDKNPVLATANGGRQVHVEEIYGNGFDHIAVEYEYENGVKGYHFSRQQNGCSNSDRVEIVGSDGKGVIDIGLGTHEIIGKNAWKYQGKPNNMYQTQHDELFASIRSGKPINDGEMLAQSTMLSILGRMAAYTGQTISYEQALNSTQILAPPMDRFNWDLKWSVEVAKPGITKFI